MNTSIEVSKFFPSLLNSAVSHVKVGREFLSKITCAKARNVKFVPQRAVVHQHDMERKSQKIYTLFSPHK